MVTLTVVLALPEPPAPEQVSVNFVVASSAPVEPEPLVPLLPVQLPPEAVHAVAFVEFQESVELAPPDTVVGEALRVTVGAGVLDVPLPPLPPPQPASANAVAMPLATKPLLMLRDGGRQCVEAGQGDSLSFFIVTSS
jgi:hypothetical protein